LPHETPGGREVSLPSHARVKGPLPRAKILKRALV
jgi:hypothetical protein